MKKGKGRKGEEIGEEGSRNYERGKHTPKSLQRLH